MLRFSCVSRVIIIVWLLISGVSISAIGQSLFAIKCANGKWGFKDINGSVAIPCRYDKVDDWFFHEGVWLVPVKLNDYWGCIDENGIVVVSIEYLWRIDAKNKKTVSQALLLAQQKATEAELIKRIQRESSFGYFSQNYVEQEINNWLQKGEFERTDDWQQRINEDNRKAKEVELLKDAEQAFIAERSKNFRIGSIALGTYDADKEVFLIINSVHGNWLAPVPINEAPDFKDNWHNLVKTPQYEIRNDRIAFAGYKFESVEVVAITEQPKDSPANQEIAANYPNKNISNDIPSNQGDIAINYANGTREIINGSTSQTMANTSKSNISAGEQAKSKGGVFIGMNFSNLNGWLFEATIDNWRRLDGDLDVNRQPGIHLGITGVMPFKKNPKFAFQSGLSYSQLGASFESRYGNNVKVTEKFTQHTLHFPLRIQFKLNDSSSTLLFYTGIYTNYLLSLKYENEITVNDKKIYSDNEIYFSEDDISVADFGVGLGAAFLIKDFIQIGVGYDKGLINSNIMGTLTLMFGR